MHILLSFFIGFLAISKLFGCSCPCGESNGTDSESAVAIASQRKNSRVENAELQDLFYKLLMTMERGYHPPMWISKFNLSPYLPKTIVYYDEIHSEAKQMVYFREPCRIDGLRKYDPEKFLALFNYTKSSISWKTQTSIAIYTFTPIRLENDEFDEINIISVFWPHLEDDSLPDKQALFNTPEGDDRNRYLSNYFHGIFSKIERCVLRNRFERIVFADFGLSESIKIAKDQFNVDHVHILQEVFRQYLWKVPSLSIGETNLPTTEVSKTGSLVDTIRAIKMSGKLDKTLFVNSANPVALLGNGNQLENTSNGIFGRMTAISVLGWGVTNKNINYELVLRKTLDANVLQIDD